MNSKSPCPRDCPDRNYSPNCHSTCSKYLDWIKERQEEKKKIMDYKIKNNVNSTKLFTKRTVKIYQKYRKGKDGY